MKALETELRAKFGDRIRAAMPLAELTSFRIGGPADLFVNVEHETELMHAKAAAYRAGVRCFCLGAGTNLLDPVGAVCGDDRHVRVATGKLVGAVGAAHDANRGDLMMVGASGE